MDENEITTDETPETDAESTDVNPEGAEALGDAGKKALDSMKARYKSERDARKALEARIAELEAPAPTDAPDAETIRREAAREATTKANARILKSEIKAAAAGKLSDPADAFRFLDVASFDIDENGDVDADEIADAIQELITNKPYLAAAKAPMFQGTGDGGAARKASGPAQLSRSDLDGMTDAQINQARKEGRLKNLLSGN